MKFIGKHNVQNITPCLQKVNGGGGQNKLKVLPLRRKPTLILLFIIVIALLGMSYALFSETLLGKKSYTLESGGLRIYLDETQTENSILLQNSLPVPDEVGLKNTPYIFSLVNEESEDLAYTIYLKEEEYDNKTPSSAIRYQYRRDIDNIRVTRSMEEQKTEDGRFYLETGVIPSHNTYRYELRMWINLDAGNEILNTKYSVQIEVEAAQTTKLYKEEILDGCDPVLSDKLIPITIDTDGTVKKASLYEDWYNYEKKEWANAVVLEDMKQEYDPGDVIPESNIESYFVWIPRYKYKIFNDGNYTSLTSLNPNAPQTIEIEFESKDTSVSNGTAKDEWLSHPAFQAFDTNGFWVGKFESGYRGATTKAGAEITTADATKLVIKPNTYSWRNNTVGNMFKTSYEYLRENESHMMKNTEWGAVAYLSHSQYGVNKEIYINNNNAYLTGCGGNIANSAETDVCLNAYGTKSDGIYYQTTTGNISGVFDMSGGAWEYVMGYNTSAGIGGGSSGITSLYGDFFTNNKWDKHYDKYVNASTSTVTYNQRILGDATGEMGPFANNISSWHDDCAEFIYSSEPWFIRGGYYGNASGAGAFSYGHYPGIATVRCSFRVVIIP